MAFPTTSVLDNFNRANENPLSTAGNWGAPIHDPATGGAMTMKLVSNAIQDDSLADGGGSGQAYWDGANFGPGAEVFVTIPTWWANASSDFWLWMHGRSEGSSAMDGYKLYVSTSGGNNIWQLYRLDNEVATQLGADLGTQNISNGDAIGLECTASGIFQAYYKASGGGWATVGSTRSESTYTSGHIGVSKGFNDTTSSLDDFGGGTIVSPGVSYTRLERGLRGLCRGVQMGAR